MTQKRAVIDQEKCDRAPGCPAKRSCPAQAIDREEGGDPYFVNSFCQGCGICIARCPKQAIKIV